MEAIKFEQVVTAYEGRAGKCCCGCSGTHTASPDRRDEASRSRGYEYGDDEVSEERVRDVLDAVNSGLDGAEFDDFFVSVTQGGRLYVVYLA